MKILQINSVCGIRSTGRICTDIATALQENGHDCRIGYGRERVPASFEPYAIRIGNPTRVKLHGIRARLFDASGFGSKQATKRFLEQIRSYDPDVIHLHNLHGYYLHVGVLFDYLKQADKPVIWTLHDCWPFTGHCANLIDCNKWQTGCHHCPKYRRYPSSYTDRSRRNYTLKKQAFCGVPNLTVVTPSQWLGALTAQSFLGKYPIKVIHNGIDTSVFKPTPSDFRERHGLQNKTIVLGVASAWGRDKGLYDFYTLANRLGDKYKVVLVGLTAEQKAALPSSILGVSRTNSIQQLAEIYTAADVFANPTYNDNYPTVNLEAQACGTPVITYHTGGSVESVPQNNIVPCGDTEALSCRIQEGNLPLKSDLQADKQSMINQYLALYQQL